MVAEREIPAKQWISTQPLEAFAFSVGANLRKVTRDFFSEEILYSPLLTVTVGVFTPGTSKQTYLHGLLLILYCL